MQHGLAVIYCRAAIGIDAPLITVEAHLANGLPAFNIVGLPEASVRESRDRVRSALINSGFEFPAKRITINLAPADLPKDGGRFDLAIAMGIIAATHGLDQRQLENTEFIGELALSGELRAVNGVLPQACAALKAGRQLVLPAENAEEASLVKGVQLVSARQLLEVFHHINGQQPLALHPTKSIEVQPQYQMDLQDVVGQQGAKRALEVAAAGAHNLLMTGPPGTGKTMLANRLLTILPPMTDGEALETASLYSVCGKTIDPQQWRQRPFRAPHHTSSAVALAGGGSLPRPGEISLSHNGVLFLDELPEFDRKVLDVLREPLEAGHVSISRAARQAQFPARFQLVAAMNPSPTGSLDDGRCNSEQILRYLNRISGPFLDRIDLQVEVPNLPKGQFSSEVKSRGDSSNTVRQRVLAARERQQLRSGKNNAELSSKEVEASCKLTSTDLQFLEHTVEQLGLSIRSYHRILKVSRTLADLEQQQDIQRHHLAEALGYRSFDRMLRQLSTM